MVKMQNPFYYVIPQKCHVDITSKSYFLGQVRIFPGGFSVLLWFDCEIQAGVVCYTLNTM